METVLVFLLKYFNAFRGGWGPVEWEKLPQCCLQMYRVWAGMGAKGWGLAQDSVCEVYR